MARQIAKAKLKGFEGAFEVRDRLRKRAQLCGMCGGTGESIHGSPDCIGCEGTGRIPPPDVSEGHMKPFPKGKSVASGVCYYRHPGIAPTRNANGQCLHCRKWEDAQKNTGKPPGRPRKDAG